MRTCVFKSVYGSRLFGTQHDGSDYDFKAIYVEDLDTLVRQHTLVDQEVSEINGVKAETEWNHIQKFAHLLSQGQTFAVELLFVPEKLQLESSPAWKELLKHRELLFSKNVMPFLGFARTQAAKYGLKGDRLAALELFGSLVDSFEKETPTYKLNEPLNPDKFNKLTETMVSLPGVSLWEDFRGGRAVKYLSVGGKSYGETTPFKLWLDPLQRSLQTYGKRAREAKDCKGMDTKSIAHAVRVSGQAIELLNTGAIHFPRPDTEHLKDIIFGKVSHDDAMDELNEKISEASALAEVSSLRETPDTELIKNWAEETQINWIKKEF